MRMIFCYFWGEISQLEKVYLVSVLAFLSFCLKQNVATPKVDHHNPVSTEPVVNASHNQEVKSLPQRGISNVCDAFSSEPVMQEFLFVPHNSCSMFLAPSTIPNAGLGVFTSIPLSPGDTLGGGDVVISLQDILNHPRSGLGKFYNPLENYNWNLRTVLINLGYPNPPPDTAISAAFVPGIESLVNSNFMLWNVAQQTKSEESRVMANVTSTTLLCALGSTPYHQLTTVVTQSIPAGGELFTYYGDDWFANRNDAIFQSVARFTDVSLAQALLEEMRAMEDGNSSSNNKMYEIDASMNYHQRWDDLLQKIPLAQRRRLQHLLPVTARDWKIALESGLQPMKQQHATTSLADLYEKGACLDIIIPKPSTVVPGGMGGFAATSIPRGTIITTSPLLCFPNYFASLDVQVWNNSTKTYETRESKPFHFRQRMLPLLVNYCWGHVESTILLCPYGTGVAYLNHPPTVDHVNVLLRWSNRTSFPTVGQEWLETDPLLWKQDKNETTRFSAFFDYVAIKDIPAGAELFIDYGREWEVEWNDFLSNRQPNFNFDPNTAQQLNQEQGVLRTEEEQDGDPYPVGVAMLCHEFIFQSQLSQSMTAEEIWGKIDIQSGYPCQVLEKHVQPGTNQITYAVRVVRPGPPGEQPVWIGRSGIPREFISFVNQMVDPEKSNVNFRHAMQLPDNIIPTAWKNMKR